MLGALGYVLLTAERIATKYVPLVRASEEIQLDVTFTIDEIVAEGDIAHALTRSNGTQLVRATGQTAVEANREVFILRRGGDSWKIARYMFNKAG